MFSFLFYSHNLISQCILYLSQLESRKMNYGQLVAEEQAKSVIGFLHHLSFHPSYFFPLFFPPLNNEFLSSLGKRNLTCCCWTCCKNVAKNCYRRSTKPKGAWVSGSTFIKGCIYIYIFLLVLVYSAVNLLFLFYFCFIFILFFYFIFVLFLFLLLFLFYCCFYFIFVLFLFLFFNSLEIALLCKNYFKLIFSVGER